MQIARCMVFYSRAKTSLPQEGKDVVLDCWNTPLNQLYRVTEELKLEGTFGDRFILPHAQSMIK